MRNIPVNILSGANLQYAQGSKLHHGDTVTFQLVDVPYEVKVSFDQDSCLSPPGPYLLDGRPEVNVTSTPPLPVPDTASIKAYRFTVTIYDGTDSSTNDAQRPRVPRGNGEVKNGELDVVTDPPPPLTLPRPK